MSKAAQRLLAVFTLYALAGSCLSQGLSPQQIASKWRKAVVTIQSGDRAGTGFFTLDGLLYAPYSLFVGNSGAVITTADGKQGRVTGVVRASKELNVVLLQTDLNRSGPALGDFGAVKPGDKVVVLSSPQSSSAAYAAVVSFKASNGPAAELQLDKPAPAGYEGAPVFNGQGDVIGMVEAGVPNAVLSSKDLKTWWTQPLSSVFGTSRVGDVAATGTLLATTKGVVGPAEAQPLQNPDNLTGIDDLQLIIDPIPAVLATDVTTGVIQQWTEARMKEYGIRLANSADKAVEFDVAQPKTQFEALAAADSRMRALEITVSAVKRSEGGASYMVMATLLRATFVQPGHYALGAVGQEWVLGFTNEGVGFKLQTSVELCVRRLLQKVKSSP
jgi:hypothetical protein